ncbi:DUF6891 domain-containing protein [Sphingomonas xinjiangensis]|uniref:DUF6891 domain-containing protein n=1 Tax=Sphingomonas xinjiangensis TaxID=643568 RepID=A0A840YH77_9SPHN|nr:hypothetical protein [Sphingomonas xinjiangensis]MBB5712244.1 hypothetical protein [Sphingomonas xinjiangensis]
MKRFFDRLFGWARASESTPPSISDAPVGDAADPLADLRDKIRRDVAAGFDDEDVILTNLAHYFEEEIDPVVVRREAPRILRDVLAEHARAEASWPAVTDCDRLDTAFAALEQDGIIARQNFTCCMTCGSNEIWEEVQAAKDAGLPAHGYTFYHFQDTDAAVEGSGVYLAYGACEDGEGPALQVANDVVAALQAQGLHPDWDGRWDQRIHVPLDWKRRRGVPGLLG